jgi:hypothetical protein
MAVGSDTTHARRLRVEEIGALIRGVPRDVLGRALEGALDQLRGSPRAQLATAMDARDLDAVVSAVESMPVEAQHVIAIALLAVAADEAVGSDE